MSKQIELLRARRFLPLLLTQTTGAFNDNLFKSAFIMLITYGAAAGPDPGVVAVPAPGTVAFDLPGPQVEVRVTRAGKTLPIAQVPTLQAGDRIWVVTDAVSDGDFINTAPRGEHRIVR